MEFLIRKRLSLLRFLGFDLGAATPDESAIRPFREKLTRAGAIDTLFTATSRPKGKRSKSTEARRRSGWTSRRGRLRRTPVRLGRSSSRRLEPAADRHRHSQLRLQEQHRDLPGYGFI